MKSSKNRLELAQQIIKDNATMFNSCLTKDELKSFNYDFAEYLIRQLEIRNTENKKNLKLNTIQDNGKLIMMDPVGCMTEDITNFAKQSGYTIKEI